MIKLIVFLFGLSIFWVTVTCFPAQLEIQENQLPLNRTLREIPCKNNEYPSQAICCQLCPAGTFVAEYCTKDHQRGSCQPCTTGEDYTAAASALEQCLTCQVCREDEVKVQACTPKTNTVCKCKPGTFCIPREVCEICMRCSRCGNGQRIKEECTATRNTVCEDIPITQPTSNTTRSHVKQVPNSTKNISPTPEKDITKDVNRTTDKDDVTQDPNSMNKTDPYIVLCIILALLTITILALFGCNVFKKNKKGKSKLFAPT
ncbi:uncharacterized protein [Pyxicephalus adspersus]|uniref:uncharacterized protein isoform X3 n=1 Tax=Pyxicephalus adspersus TaxID=30357 RepID=UPI003B5C5145